MTKTTMTPTTREDVLRDQLRDRRRELQSDFHGRIRSGRTVSVVGGGDDMDHIDRSNQTDMEMALLQMRGETLLRIDEALARLDDGKYGSCNQCGDDIAPRRLLALPFAVRCQGCEARHEQNAAQTRTQNKFVSYPAGRLD